MRGTTGMCHSISRRCELLSALGMNDVFYDVDAPRLVVHGPTALSLMASKAVFDGDG